LNTTEQERIAQAKQIAEEYKDLPIFNPDFDFSPEQYEKMFEDHRRELDAENNSTMLFDPTDKNRRTYADCKDRYGKELADKMLKAKNENNGRLSKSDYAELMRSHEKKKSPITPTRKDVKKPRKDFPTTSKDSTAPNRNQTGETKIEQKEQRKGDDYFLKTERGLIRNESYRAIFKGPGLVYEWLWANIVREQWKDSPEYPIKERYYDRGYLAYCSSYGHLADACGMSKNTVHKFIKIFEEAGIIKTEMIVPEGKIQGQTVFILGRWQMRDGKRTETYFRDSVLPTQKPVKI